MKITTTTNSSSKPIKNQDTQVIQIGNSASKANTTQLTTISEQFLLNREITTVDTPSINREQTQYSIGLRIYAKVTLKTFIKFIKEKINPSFEYNYEKDSNTWKLLDHIAKLNAYMSKLQAGALMKKLFLSIVGTAIESKLPSKTTDPQKDKITEIIYTSFGFYTIITQQFFTSKNYEETLLSDFTVDSVNDEMREIPAKLNLLIDSTIKNFNQIITKKYYPLFRMLVDDVSLEEKAKALTTYIGHRVKSYENAKEILNIGYCMRAVEDVSTHLAALQILITLLQKAQKNPTLLNCIKASRYCDFCVVCFDMKTKTYQQYKKNQSNPPLTLDFFTMKTHLTTLNKALVSLGVISRPNSDGDWLQTPTVQHFKKSAAKTPPQKVCLPTQKPLAIMPINPSNDEIKIQEPAVQMPPIETPLTSISTDVPNTIDNLVKEVPQIPIASVPQIPLSENIPEDDESDLFESILLLFQEDRRKKLEYKEAKAKEALALKKALIEAQKEESLDLDPADRNILSPKKSLSAKKQLMLEKVFAKKIENLEFSHKKIKSLFKALGGKSEGAGGQYFHCYWGNSKKQGGIYEVVHGRDGKHYLKYEQILQVQVAIRTGLAYKTIPVELIPAHLLPIILKSENN